MGRRRRKVRIVKNVEITGVADKGRGVGRDEGGKVVFVEHVAPGDVVDVRIVRSKTEYSEGYPVHYHRLSEDRVEPFCRHFGVCGGCRWQHVTYESQIHHKELMVRNALQRIGKVEVREFLPIIGAERTTYYRNKLEFAFSNKRWLTAEEIESGTDNRQNVLGFHRPGAFDKIVDIEHCYLQPDPSNRLRNTVRRIADEQGLSFFDMRANTGLMRHILIRITTLGQVMLVVSFHEDDPPKIRRFLDAVIAELPEITSLFYCINPKLNDYVLDLDMIHYHGQEFIEEQLGHIRFRIGPKSFFQTNSYQARVLYDRVVDFAQLKGTENVYDLYTGIGSIALYVARSARQVVGIEEVPEAIEDARMNAALNGIENCLFYAGDVKDVLTPEFARKHGKPDLLITDPPRAGMHADVVDMLRRLQPPRIVYVSCNPATQARDLHLLSDFYEVLKVQPVDMFPHTHHVETVALLQLL